MKKIISFLCAVICAVVIAACSGGYDSPEAVVKQYASYVQNEQYEKIQNIMYFKNELTKEQKIAFVQMIGQAMEKSVEKHGAVKAIEITETAMAEDGATARVRTVTQYGDGYEYKDKVKTILVDGYWLLDAGI